MVENIGNTHPHQAFSLNGMKLTELKENNELLFNYFKKAGYKDDSVIYSTDIEKLTKDFDANGDGKLSQKELKAMLGDDVSRSQRRAARKSLDVVKQNDLSMTEGLLPETIDETTTNYRDNKGTLIYTENDKPEYKEQVYYLNGVESKVDKIIQSHKQIPSITTTEYLDGEMSMPKKVTIEDNGNVKTKEFQYEGNRLHTTTEKYGNNITFTKYINDNEGKPVPKLIMEQYDSDRESFESIENRFDENGNLIGRVVEYNGAKVDKETGILKEDYVFIEPKDSQEAYSTTTAFEKPEDVKSMTLSVNGKDNKVEEQLFKQYDGKLHRYEKDEKGVEFVTVQMPKGWTIDKLAKSFGVKTDDILNANKDSDGDALYHTNSAGVNYFYANQKVRVNNPIKMPDSIPEDKFLWGEDAKLPEIEKKIEPTIDSETFITRGSAQQRHKVGVNSYYRAPKAPESCTRTKTGYKATVKNSNGSVSTFTMDNNKNVIAVKTDTTKNNVTYQTIEKYDSAGHKISMQTSKNGSIAMSRRYEYRAATTYDWVQSKSVKIVSDYPTAVITTKKNIETGKDISTERVEYVKYSDKPIKTRSVYESSGCKIETDYHLNGEPMKSVSRSDNHTVVSYFDRTGTRRYMKQSSGSSTTASQYSTEHFYDVHGNETNRPGDVNGYINKVVTA